MMDPADYLTITQAAESLSVSDAAIRKAILKGRLPSIELFGRKLVSRLDVNEYRERTRPDGSKPRGRPKKVQ